MPNSTQAQTTQADLDQVADEIATLWVEDECIDGPLPEHLQRKTANYKTGKSKTDTWDSWGDDLGGIDKPTIGRPVDLLNDPEVLNELARRDPKFRARLDEQRQEEVSLNFTRQNPAYLPTPENFSKMLMYISKKYLDAPHLDEDDVIREAYKLGFWTVEILNEVFKILSRQGKLAVEFGKTKLLSKQDQLEVIAQIREGDLAGGCLTYISRSYGSSVPEFTSTTDFLTKNSELASEAAKFVFYHSKATISPSDWKAFSKEKLANRPMLTYELIDDAWTEWKANTSRLLVPRLVPAKEPPPEPTPPTQAELELLPDSEIERLRIAALREMYRR